MTTEKHPHSLPTPQPSQSTDPDAAHPEIPGELLPPTPSGAPSSEPAQIPEAAAATKPAPKNLWQKGIEWILGKPIPQPASQTNPTQNQAAVSEQKSRFVEIGWLVDTRAAGFIWEGPRPINRRLPKPESSKAVQKCPGILDVEKRFHVINAPYDLHVGVKRDDKGRWVFVNKAGPESSIYPGKVQDALRLSPINQWRHHDKPIIQVGTPYRFISDEPAWAYQLPPFLHYGANAWPGTVIAGRLPIHIWPRVLMWAFEWHDTSKDLIIRRGEPWFFVHVEIEDPTRPIRMTQAQMTPELREYCSSLDSVTNYVNQTYSLFDVALERRPPKLLVPHHSKTANQSSEA